MGSTIKLERTRAHQRYKLADGTIVPGVTTVIGCLNLHNKCERLLGWANNLGLSGINSQEYKHAMGAIGTLTHSRIVAHFKKEELDLSEFSPAEIELSDNCMLKFYAWEKVHKVKSVFIEKPLVSEAYRFGGTLDLYGMVDGIETVLDWKTSTGIYLEMLIQLAGYQLLLVENGYVGEVKQGIIVNIGKAEDFKRMEVTIDDFALLRRLFLDALDIYELGKKVSL